MTRPGDLTRDNQNGDTFTYDGLSMMTGATVPASPVARSFVDIYTADDERLGLVETTTGNPKTRWTLRDLDGHLLRTWVDDATSGSHVWSWSEDEIWRGSSLLASESPTGTKHFGLDHLGSPVVVTKAGGVLVGTEAFDAFGGGGATSADMLQYTGQERDAYNVDTTSGIANLPDYFHARFYDILQGRFLSVDRHSGEPHRPQSWNRYAYASNNPLARIDPDGLKDFSVVVQVQQVIDPNQVRGGNAYQQFNLQHPGANVVERPFNPVAHQISGDYKTNNRLVIRGDVTNSVVTITSMDGSTASLGQTHVGPMAVNGVTEMNTGPDVSGAGTQQVQVSQAIEGHINPFLAFMGGAHPISIGSSINVTLTGQGEDVQTNWVVTYSRFPTTFVCTSGTDCTEYQPLPLETVLGAPKP